MKKNAKIRITRNQLRRIIQEVCQICDGDEIIDEDTDEEIEESAAYCPACDKSDAITPADAVAALGMPT